MGAWCTSNVPLAHSIFRHAAARQIRAWLDAARRAMAPGAKLVATFFVATFCEGEKDDAGDARVDLAGVTDTPATFERMAKESGLFLETVEGPHPAGQRWVVLSPMAPG